MELNNGLNKKERILQAALEAYARHGIRDATVKQIAAIAGIGKSTVFEYFANSAELMDEAFAFYIARTNAGWAGLLEMAETDPVAALNRYFDTLIQMIVAEPDKLLLISQYVTAIIAAGSTFSDVKQGYAAKLQPAADAMLANFKAIVSAGISSGAFRPAGGLGAADCALLINAIVREMQSQAFVQDEHSIRIICQRLKRAAFTLLGATIRT